MAEQIRALQLDTGDDVATVATGIGVEPGWAAAVVDGEVAEVDLDHIQRVCEAFHHCTPYDLWGVKGGRGIAYAYGPELRLWPRYLEPLEAATGVGIVDSADLDGPRRSGSGGGRPRAPRNRD